MAHFFTSFGSGSVGRCSHQDEKQFWGPFCHLLQELLLGFEWVQIGLKRIVAWAHPFKDAIFGRRGPWFECVTHCYEFVEMSV